MGLKLNSSPMEYYKSKNSSMKKIDEPKAAEISQASVVNSKSASGGEEAGEYEKLIENQKLKK